MVISRRTYDQLVGQIKVWQGLYEVANRENKELNERMHGMVRDGFRPPADPGTEPDFFELPMELVAAISDRARSAEMARDMEQYARRQLSLDVSVEQVAQDIYEGQG